jgi:hypothetical protein
MFAVGYGYSTFSIPFKDAGQLITVRYPITIMGQVGYDDDGSLLRGGYEINFYDLAEDLKKWTMSIRNCGEALHQFAVIYADRVPL